MINATLTKISLSHNDICYFGKDNGSGPTHLSTALKANSTLTAINLSANRIRNLGATQLSNALLINSTLREMDLSQNPIRYAGIARLCDALQMNTTLKELSLEKNVHR